MDIGQRPHCTRTLITPRLIYVKKIATLSNTCDKRISDLMTRIVSYEEAAVGKTPLKKKELLPDQEDLPYTQNSSKTPSDTRNGQSYRKCIGT